MWIYTILFLVIFHEMGLVATPFLPGDSLLFATGGVAAVGGVNIHIMMLTLLIAAILGDAVNFMIGKYFGTELFSDPDPKIFRRAYLEKTRVFCEKHGGKTIIIAHFVSIVRTFVPFVTGMGDMHYGKFIRCDIIGTLVWVLLFSYLGYFSANIPLVKNNLGLVLGAVIVIFILPVVIEIVRIKYTAKE